MAYQKLPGIYRKEDPSPAKQQKYPTGVLITPVIGRKEETEKMERLRKKANEAGEKGKGRKAVRNRKKYERATMKAIKKGKISHSELDFDK